MAQKSKETPRKVDTDADRYPDIRKVCRKVFEDPDYPEGDVERIEVYCQASGEASYRVWAARSVEPVVGYLPEG